MASLSHADASVFKEPHLPDRSNFREHTVASIAHYHNYELPVLRAAAGVCTRDACDPVEQWGVHLAPKRCEGRRVKKIAGAETTVFVYNASGQLVAEYSTQTSQTPQVSYLTTDHLGSPRVITDQLGVVKDRKDYSAFGDETITAQRVSGLGYGSAADEVRKGYTGYEKDGESGLEFAQARYYSTTHGNQVLSRRGFCRTIKLVCQTL
ncbi:MAG: RHS repeat domain-containing protein [Pyrinomonadaceae bacterium]